MFLLLLVVFLSVIKTIFNLRKLEWSGDYGKAFHKEVGSGVGGSLLYRLCYFFQIAIGSVLMCYQTANGLKCCCTEPAEMAVLGMWGEDISSSSVHSEHAMILS